MELLLLAALRLLRRLVMLCLAPGWSSAYS
jgi:hypothetical protein